MQKRTAALAVLAVCGLAGLRGLTQDKKPPQSAAEFTIPPEETKRENPVKPTPPSIAEGRKMYMTQCAMCHGKEGDGKGDLVEDMKLKLKDYRDPDALKGMTDGDLHYILVHGKGDMPGQEDRMDARQCWNLINYIRSLAKGKATSK